MAVPVPPKGRAATAPSAAVGLRVFLRFQSMIMLVLSFVWVVVQHNNNNGLQEHGTSISGGGRANNDDGPEEKYLQQLRNSSYARPSSITGYSRATTTRRDKMTPLSCSNVLAGPLAKSDPNMGVIHKRRTTTNPPFTISLHNETVDRTRWAIMEYGFYYEKFITKHAGDLLIANSTRVPKDSIFVDVGMNIFRGYERVNIESHELPLPISTCFITDIVNEKRSHS